MGVQNGLPSRLEPIVERLPRVRHLVPLVLLVLLFAQQPCTLSEDSAYLYGTCCFGGSDYIGDPALNSAHQQAACRIRKDDALWNQNHCRYKRMRLWHFKGCDRLNTLMRADYDS